MSSDDLDEREPGADPEFCTELATLQQHYLEGLPARLCLLQDALESVRVDGPDPARVKETWRLAHNLRGTAGCYGFENLGDLGARLEQLIDDLLDTKARADVLDEADAVMQQILALAASLR